MDPNNEFGGSGRQDTPRLQNQQQDIVATDQQVNRSLSGTVRILSNEQVILTRSVSGNLCPIRLSDIRPAHPVVPSESLHFITQGSPHPVTRPDPSHSSSPPEPSDAVTPPEEDNNYEDILLPSLAAELAVDSGSECDEEELLTQDQIREILEANDDIDEQVDESLALLSDNLHWSDDFSTFTGSEEIYANQPGPTITSTNPIELFTAVWDRSFMEKIVKETNDYAWQTIVSISEADGLHSQSRLNEWEDVTVDELYKFFGILLYMGLCYRSRLEEYWTTGVLTMPEFRKIMGINRFLLIMRFLHFVNNYELDMSIHGNDRKTAKIDPVVQHCNEKFGELYTPRRHLSLDESLLLWKGRLTWVQCIRTKAARFGIKTYELCEAESGYLLKFYIYTGKESGSSEPLHGFTGATSKVVLRLVEGYLNKGHCLVMDNFYNSVALTQYLKQNRTDSFGTLNRRRVDTPADIKGLDPKLMRKGDIVARHCNNINVLAWKDIKLVTLISTYHNADTAPGSRAGVACAKPLVVHSYNKYMGGVDMKDQKLSMYLLERKRGSKWYIKVFRRLLNCSVLNTFIMHRFNCTASDRKLSHRQYRYVLADQLVKQHLSVQRIRPSAIANPSIVRLDGVDHFPDHIQVEARGNKSSSRYKRGRCVRCIIKKKRTEVNVICAKCQVFLCIGQCWREHHTLQP